MNALQLVLEVIQWLSHCCRELSQQCEKHQDDEKIAKTRDVTLFFTPYNYVVRAWCVIT